MAGAARPNGERERAGSARATAVGTRSPATLGAYFPDLNGIPRGKEMAGDAVADAIENGVGLTASIFALDYGGDAVEGTGLGPEILFRDLVVRPDPATMRGCPWTGGAIALADVEFDQEPARFAPRTILRNVIAEYGELGLEPVIGVELEFHVLRTENGGFQPYDDVPGALYMPPSHAFDPRGLIDQIQTWAEAMEIRITKLAREFSRGQYELNLAHEDALAAVDAAFLFKIATKEAAARAGLLATFMGRPLEALGGSGLHLHVSLRSADGANAFDGADEPYGLTPFARSFVAGCMEHVRGSIAVLAPNVNAYKRFTTLSLAPYYLTWGLDNRTTTLRVPDERGAATRVEHRLPDGAANLYTSAALVLAAGLEGIRRKAEPDEPFDGNASLMAELDLPRVPANLREALADLERDEVITGVLGPQFVQSFTAMKRAELHRYESIVTEWETRQYARHL